MIGAVQPHHYHQQHQRHEPHHGRTGRGARAEPVAGAEPAAGAAPATNAEVSAGVALSAGAYREARSASFTFVTADGDTVKIDSSTTREFAYATYESDGQMAAGVRSSASSSASLTVEGTLDPEELQDIRKALTFLRRAGQDGQIDEREMETFTRRQDIDSLQSIAGRIEVSRSAVSLDVVA